MTERSHVTYWGDITMAFACVVTGGFVLGYGAWPPFVQVAAAATTATGFLLAYRAVKAEKRRISAKRDEE